MPQEQTLIICKPDCVKRRLVGRVIQRFEDKGLTIAAMKLIHISKSLAERHYAVHKGKTFYDDLIAYITSGPVVAMVIAGPRAISTTRKLMGATFGYDADPGSIRGDFGLSTTYNLVHGSDSVETAEVEIPIYFKPEELLDYHLPDADCLIKPSEA